ncbi:MAG: PadR family transcriptional regulator [Candidatus Hodarchaeales archaeon]
MDVTKWETEFKKGFSKPFVLLSLSKAPNYPYGVTKAVNEKTGGKFTIAGSNIYPLLSQMEKMQFIIKKQEKESGKKIYQLTEDGKEFLVSLKQAMKDFVEIIKTMLDITD